MSSFLPAEDRALALGMPWLMQPGFSAGHSVRASCLPARSVRASLLAGGYNPSRRADAAWGRCSWGVPPTLALCPICSRARWWRLWRWGPRGRGAAVGGAGRRGWRPDGCLGLGPLLEGGRGHGMARARARARTTECGRGHARGLTQLGRGRRTAALAGARAARAAQTLGAGAGTGGVPRRGRRGRGRV